MVNKQNLIQKQEKKLKETIFSKLFFSKRNLE